MAPVSGSGMKGTFSPSKRILELARHKCSKTVWLTTPCEKLTWGNQEPIWPPQRSVPARPPSSRTNGLARPKRDLTAGGHNHTREEGSFWMRNPSLCNSSKRSQAELVRRLSAPRPSPLSSEEPGAVYGHTQECDSNCSVWHVDLGLRDPKVSPRLLVLSRPKTLHPHFQSNRQLGATKQQVLEKENSRAVRAHSKSPRLERLSLPRLRPSQTCFQPGRPEEPIYPVSMAAQRASASRRIVRLAKPKQFADGYDPPRGT